MVKCSNLKWTTLDFNKCKCEALSRYRASPSPRKFSDIISQSFPAPNPPRGNHSSDVLHLNLIEMNIPVTLTCLWTRFNFTSSKAIKVIMVGFFAFRYNSTLFSPSLFSKRFRFLVISISWFLQHMCAYILLV